MPRRIIVERGYLKVSMKIRTSEGKVTTQEGGWVESPNGQLYCAYYSDDPASAVTAWQPDLAVKNLIKLYREDDDARS